MSEDDILDVLLNDYLILHEPAHWAIKRRVAGEVLRPSKWGSVEGTKLVAAVNELTPERASFLLAKVMVQTP